MERRALRAVGLEWVFRGVAAALAASPLLVFGCSAEQPTDEATAVTQQALNGQVRLEVTELLRDNTFASSVEARLEIFDFTPPTSVPVNLDDEVLLAQCGRGAECQLQSAPFVGRWTRQVSANQVVIDGKLLLRITEGNFPPSFNFCLAVSLDTTTGALSPAPTTPGKCIKDTGGLAYDPVRDMKCGAAANLPANACRFSGWITSDTSNGTPWSMTFSTSQSCLPTGIEVCDGIDNNCNGATDEQFPFHVTCGAAGACAGSQTFTCVDGVPGATACTGVTQPAPEVLDRVDNDCDGEADECDPGNWWCSCANGPDLTFNVVPTADTSIPPACIPTTVDPNATCSLRGAFFMAEFAADHGCSVTANVASGHYAIGSELELSSGTLRLIGQGSGTTFIEPVVPPGECATLCTPSPDCNDECYDDPFGVGSTCAPECDATCNRKRDRNCIQACNALPSHRLVNVTAAPGKQPSFALEGMTLSGGRVPGIGGDGAGILISGASFAANRVVLENNWAQGFGVGLAVLSSPSATIFDSVIRNNINLQLGGACEATSGSQAGGGATARGGGIFVSNSVMTIERSAILGNATSDAGGIYAALGGSLTVRNSTISGNTTPGRGGGILTEVDTTLEFNTIAFNRAAMNPGNDSNHRGGGVATGVPEGVPARRFRAFGNMIVSNFIPGMSGRSLDCNIESTPPGFVLERDYNFIQDGTGDCAALVTPNTITGQPPEFIAARSASFGPDFAPATPASIVHDLSATSPAVDFYPAPGSVAAGAPACPIHDQRGLLRDAFGCDLGAYETEGRADSDGDGIADDVDPQPFILSNAFSDVAEFGVTEGSVVDRNGNFVVIHEGSSSDDGVAIRVAGTGGPARFLACGGRVEFTVAAGESRLFTCPRPTSCVFAKELLTVRDRADVLSDLFGGTFAIGLDAHAFGNAFSRGNGSLGDRSIVEKNARLGGTLSGNRAGVRGTLSEHASVDAQSLFLRSVATSGAPVTVPLDGSKTLHPGNHGSVLVRSRGTLTLAEPGIYRFSSLTFEPDAQLKVPGTGDRTVLAVSGNLTLGDRLLMKKLTSGALDSRRTLFYTNGTSVNVGFDITLPASLEAPNATLEVRDRSTVRGCIGGRAVTIGFDATVGE